jgi:hypothetical protein
MPQGKCLKCKNIVDMSLLYCIECGVVIKDWIEPKGRKERKNHFKGILVITLVFAVLISLVVAATFLVTMPAKIKFKQPGESVQNSIDKGASLLISKLEEDLKSLNIDVKQIKVIDSRSKVGKKEMVIIYITSPNPNNHIKEITQILAAGFLANGNFKANLDSIVVTADNFSGKHRAVFSAKIKDIGNFIKTKNSTEYLKRLEVAYFDKTFIPGLAKE